MRRKNSDLHGNAPDKSPTALLFIDVINDLEFSGGEKLLEQALPMARRLRELKRRAKAAGLPIVYANDNFGRWQSNFNAQVRHCLEDGVRGQPVAELLQPQEDDYFVLKPKHSGFFSTSLDILLDHLEVRRLIITGMATDICVLFTAHDAYMRDFEIMVPADCVAAENAGQSDSALQQIRRVLKGDIRESVDLKLSPFNQQE